MASQEASKEDMIQQTSLPSDIHFQVEADQAISSESVLEVPWPLLYRTSGGVNSWGSRLALLLALSVAGLMLGALPGLGFPGLFSAFVRFSPKVPTVTSAASPSAFVVGKPLRSVPIVRGHVLDQRGALNRLDALGRNAVSMSLSTPDSPTLVQQLQDRRIANVPFPVIISPSVAKADMLHLGADLQAAVDGGAEWLHFSVQDGKFVPKMGIGSPVVAAARAAFPSTVIDVKLGCVDPEYRVAEFAKAGADIISFHPEATKQPAAVVQAIKYAGCAPGLVLNPGTSVSSIEALLGEVDVIVVMLVSPGRWVSSWLSSWSSFFIDGALRKIQEIHSLCESRGLPLPYIEIDGGVSAKNAEGLIQAGATVLVAGVSVFSADDKKSAIDALRMKKARLHKAPGWAGSAPLETHETLARLGNPMHGSFERGGGHLGHGTSSKMDDDPKIEVSSQVL